MGFNSAFKGLKIQFVPRGKRIAFGFKNRSLKMAQVCGGGPVADYSELSGSREGYERVFQLLSDSLML